MGKARKKGFQKEWLEKNPQWKLWIQPVLSDETKFHCIACNENYEAGLYQIQRHLNYATHSNNVKKLESLPSLETLGVNQLLESAPCEVSEPMDIISASSNLSLISPEEELLQKQTRVAEIRFTALMVEHNIPPVHVQPLLTYIEDLASTSQVLHRMKVSRTKCTNIINKVIAPCETTCLSETLKHTKFSIHIDETSDITRDKWMSVLVRYIDPTVLEIRCELLQMVHLDPRDCSAVKIFDAFANLLTHHNIPWKNVVALATDNANLMTGDKNSFYSRLIEKNPQLLMYPCVCHSASAAGYACAVLPSYCEKIITKVTSYVNRSPKRLAIFKEIQKAFEGGGLKLLLFAETRWLTRHKAIQRILQYWTALNIFFNDQVEEGNCKRANELMELINNPSTKAYLLFLEFTLNVFKELNASFQREETRIHLLRPRSIEMGKFFAGKFLKSSLLERGLHNLQPVDFTLAENRIPLENVDVGGESQMYLEDMIELGSGQDEVDDIRRKCVEFYEVATKEIIKRLPINDLFLGDLQVFSADVGLFTPERDETCTRVINVSRKFGGFDEVAIRDEWEALHFRPIHHRRIWAQLSFDSMWKEICSVRTESSDFLFPNLRLLLRGIRALAHSNASAERAFSIITDVKTKKRNKMGALTLQSICVLKMVLRAWRKTAMTMCIDDRHTILMNPENLYSRPDTNEEDELQLDAA